MNELCAIVINYCAPEATRRYLDSLRTEVFDTVRVIDNSAGRDHVRGTSAGDQL